ncbi:MAG: hypothetical protein ACLRU3_01650 [Paraclostridium sp.]|uniref:Uncharacterized protein n=1 Tax=Paraclostridium bifermentans TaxID=1490 RepID=A0ABY8R1V8_PARBF|nr:hypothetical protein QJS64_12095 [Paraclostridium bifermentans]
MNEEEKLKLISEDMFCNKYDMDCQAVPYEVIDWIGGLGFSGYTCKLNCRECEEMEEI